MDKISGFTRHINISKRSDEINKEDTLIEVSKKILNVNIGALNETFQLLDYEELEKAVDYLLTAKRIVFFWSGVFWSNSL